MGNSIAKPSKFLDCFDEDGDLDVEKYIEYNKRVFSEEVDENPRKKQSRQQFPRRDPKQTTWYLDYVVDEHKTFCDPNHRDGKAFRVRFRLPYKTFKEMVEECRNSPSCWWEERPDAAGRPPVPVELLLLGALRVLGRGWVWDDVVEATHISETVLRGFFKRFTKHYATVRKDEFIHAPDTVQEIEEIMRVYREAGVPGAIGSVDCVHVWWDRCPVNISNVCRGKEKYPTLAWQVVADHKRRILSVSRSHYGAENDLTISKYDDFVMGMHWGSKYKDVEFELFDASGNIKKMKGFFLICDGGYHMWRCLQCPLKFSTVQEELRWSKWVESLRKDVECTFGILKGRFRILKCGIRMQKRDLLHNTRHLLRTSQYAARSGRYGRRLVWNGRAACN